MIHDEQAMQIESLCGVWVCRRRTAAWPGADAGAADDASSKPEGWPGGLRRMRWVPYASARSWILARASAARSVIAPGLISSLVSTRQCCRRRSRSPDHVPAVADPLLVTLQWRPDREQRELGADTARRVREAGRFAASLPALVDLGAESRRPLGSNVHRVTGSVMAMPLQPKLRSCRQAFEARHTQLAGGLTSSGVHALIRTHVHALHVAARHHALTRIYCTATVF